MTASKGHVTQTQAARIPRLYEGSTLRHIEPGGEMGVGRSGYNALHRWSERHPWFLDRGVGLLLWGDNGVGKTYAGCALLRLMITQCVPCLYITAPELKQELVRPTPWADGQTLGQRARTVSVLLLDDLGKEYSKDGGFGFAELAFENLMRARAGAMLTTLVTMNLSLDAFAERYARSALSLAQEVFVPVQLKGPDKRKALAKRNKEMLCGQTNGGD